MRKKVLDELNSKLDNLAKMFNGGPGSGNWGHYGRPGEIGGSSKRIDNSKLAHPELAQWVRIGHSGKHISWESIEASDAIEKAKERASFDKDTLDEFKGDKLRANLHEKIQREMLNDETNGSFTGKDENGKEMFNGKVDQNKEAFLIIGPPAAGKSTVFANPISKENNARIIDSDDVKKKLPEFDNGYGAGRVQRESAMIADNALAIATDRGDNVVIPRVGGESVVALARGLKLKGYKVHLKLNDVSTESSVTRAMTRFAMTGRYLDPSYLKSIGDKPVRTFKKYANDKTLFDDAEWKNNDVPFGAEPKLIWKTGDSLDKLK